MFRLLLCLILAVWIVFVVAVISVLASGILGDEKVLAFSMAQDAEMNNHWLRIYDVDTGVTHTQYDPNSDHFDVQWSPDGQQIAYLRSTGIVHSVHVLDVEQPLQKICNLPSYVVSSRAQWSPDGQFLLVSNPQAVYLVDLVNGAMQDITQIGISAQPSFVTWLADSQHVIMRAEFRHSDSRYAIIDVTDPEQIEYLPRQLNLYEQMMPLPDESGYILLSGWEISLVATDNLAVPIALHDAHAAYSHLTLSPDGQRIAFVSKPHPSFTEPWAMSVMDIRTGTYDIIVWTQGIVRDIAWSSDGEWLVYSFTPTRSSQMYREIYRIRPDGTEQHRIHAGYMMNTHPVWQPQ